MKLTSYNLSRTIHQSHLSIHTNLASTSFTHNKTHRPTSTLRQHLHPKTTTVFASQQDGASSGALPVTTNPHAGDPLPTLLNNIPHPRETRRHFYGEIVTGIHQAIAAGELRLAVTCTIPELNVEFDVYRVGTLLELIREIALSLATDGKKVKCIVQQALGQGVFQGTPLSLSGVKRIMDQMDWGPSADQILTGNLGASEVEDADAIIVIAPQNIVGHSVLPLLAETTQAATEANKPIIIVNARLTDVQSSGGIMGVRGRQERLDYVATFTPAYYFRLLYLGVNMYPIMGCLRYTFGGPWEVLKRHQIAPGKEEYRLQGSFDHQPNASEITECFQVKR